MSKKSPSIIVQSFHVALSINKLYNWTSSNNINFDWLIYNKTKKESVCNKLKEGLWDLGRITFDLEKVSYHR